MTTKTHLWNLEIEQAARDGFTERTTLTGTQLAALGVESRTSSEWSGRGNYIRARVVRMVKPEELADAIAARDARIAATKTRRLSLSEAIKAAESVAAQFKPGKVKRKHAIILGANVALAENIYS